MQARMARWMCAPSIVAVMLGVSAPVYAQTFEWASVDVGDVGAAGTANWNNGVWTLEGAGADIWGTDDAFHFLYRPAQLPDGQLIARIDDLLNTNSYAKVGLMLRGNLAADAATVILDMKPSGEIEFMARSSDGAEMLYWGGTFVTAPAWLKLEYTASTASNPTVTAFASQDGTNFRVVNQITFTLPSSYDIGVAVTSHDDPQLTTAHVEGLSWVPLSWTNQDIGAVGLIGSTVIDPSQQGVGFTIVGAGADIWGSTDAFQFVSQQTTSQFVDIRARVTNEQASNSFAKVGLMIRDGFASDAAFVILDMKPSGELEFMQRPADGTDVMYLGGQNHNFNWLRLVRSNSTVTAYSSDGSNWVFIGSTTINMTGVNVGIAVTSHDTTQINLSSVDSVSVVTSEP